MPGGRSLLHSGRGGVDLVIAGRNPAIQFSGRQTKGWMPVSSTGMTWVGAGAIWY